MVDFKSLGEFVRILEENGELIRVKEYVNPHLQITEIIDRLSKTEPQNKAVLFENTGTDFPLLINSMGNEDRIKMALRVDNLEKLTEEVKEMFADITGPKNGLLDKLAMLPKLSKMASFMPKVVHKKAACQEVRHMDPDLSIFPILQCWPLDGGQFLTLPSVHTLDPISGIRNIGMYRMQVFDKNTTAMHWHKHKVSARHFREYKKLNKIMPVAVALGGDPVYTYAATAPIPDHIDEYILAGFLRQRRVELVPCITQPDIQVPVDADIVIEGYVDPSEDLAWEGPFGDHTGFYSLADWYPNFHVTAITHRKDAIYPATIVGIPPQEDAWIGKATEKIFLNPIKLTVIPEISDMHMPVEGVFHNLVLTKIEKNYPGQALKVMNAMWGAGQMMFNKILVVLDDDIDLEDYEAVARTLCKNFHPARDAHFSVGPMDVLDHSCSALGFGGKMCLDGTKKLDEEIKGYCNKKFAAPEDIPALEKALENIEDVAQYNTSLIAKEVSCLIVSIEKNRPQHVKELHDKISALDMPLPKIVIYIDKTKNINNISDVLWMWSNSMDPLKDKYMVNECLGLDGSRKTKKYDNFDRDWPNIIVMDPNTINEVDDMWPRLGLGPFIASPSLKYTEDVIGEEAEAYRNN